MYIIDKVAVEYIPLQGQNVYIIWYSNDAGEPLYLRIDVGVYELTQAYSPKEFLIEKVAAYDSNLYLPLREWLHNNYPDSKPVWKDLSKFSEGAMEFKKSIQKAKPKYSDHNQHTKHIHVNPMMYDNGGVSFPVSTVSSFTGGEDAGVAALPALNEKVKHPPIDNPAAQCGDEHKESSIKSLVMHLNDWHKWTREQIADWLETLDVDLRFKSPDDRLRDEKAKQIEGLRLSIESIKDSIQQWNAQIKEAHYQIGEFNKKMTQLQEEQNEQD